MEILSKRRRSFFFGSILVFSCLFYPFSQNFWTATLADGSQCNTKSNSLRHIHTDKSSTIAINLMAASRSLIDMTSNHSVRRPILTVKQRWPVRVYCQCSYDVHVCAFPGASQPHGFQRELWLSLTTLQPSAHRTTAVFQPHQKHARNSAKLLLLF